MINSLPAPNNEILIGIYSNYHSKTIENNAHAIKHSSLHREISS